MDKFAVGSRPGPPLQSIVYGTLGQSHKTGVVAQKSKYGQRKWKIQGTTKSTFATITFNKIGKIKKPSWYSLTPHFLPTHDSLIN